MLLAFFNLILSKIAAVLTWFGKLWQAIFQAGWDFIKDCGSWVLEQLLEIVVDALAALDVSELSSSAGAWGSLPAETLNVLGLIGMGTACQIIAAAIGVRLVLQLIPFTRLGS
jgi:hypothetical protein